MLPPRALPLTQLLPDRQSIAPPFTRDDVGGEPAWGSLVRDGDVIELWEGCGVPHGTVITPTVRAQAVAAHVPHGVVVGRLTAAWIHTGAPRPVRLCVLHARDAARPRPSRLLESSQSQVRPWECEEIAGLRVTNPVRTALDVATWCPDEVATKVLSDLFATGVTSAECLARLDRVVSWRGAEGARIRLLRAGRRHDQVGMRVSADLDPVIR